MARVHILLYLTLLFASVTLLDVVSAHLVIKPALPQIEDPKTLNDVEPYTVKVVMVFVSDLEKECPKTSKFKLFFEKVRAYAKYVCPIKNDQNDYDRDMKAKAGSLFQTISSFAIGKIKEEIQEEKMEAINTFRWMKSVAGKIIGGHTKDENEASMTLTTEQQKEIKEGILKWETVIARITNTMVLSTTTNSSSSENSTSGKGSSESSKSSGSGISFKDTTGSSSNFGSPSESPSSSPSGSNSVVADKAETSFTDTTGGNSIVSSGSPTNSPSEDSTKSASSGSVSVSQNKAMTVTEVEAETSKQVISFIMNLEKKCPEKEEYKLFFEKLKGTMTGSSKVTTEKRKGLFSRIRSAAGKLSDAMAFMRSRIGSKSAEVKKSMESYQGEVMQALQELDAIHSKIASQNQSKKGGSLTCSETQQAEIKQTITKWEQVTTQFVETAIQSESSSTSSSSSSSSSSSLGKLQAN